VRAADAADRLLVIVGQAGTGATFAAMSAGGGAMAASPRPMSRTAASASPRRTRFGMASSTPSSASPPGWPARASPRRLQNPWVLGAFAPGWWRCRSRCSASTTCSCLARWPAVRRHRAAHACRPRAGVFAMGGVSALIVSPCVAAPLAGALLYLSQTRDVWLGGTALFPWRRA
jgi:cytochrome c biogenesis protein CcdA